MPSTETVLERLRPKDKPYVYSCYLGRQAVTKPSG
jgi:hypothetical protein